MSESKRADTGKGDRIQQELGKDFKNFCQHLSHGRCAMISLKAAEILAEKYDIDAEVIDLRSIRPLDEDAIIASVKKTNRLLLFDEDVPGGATAFMMQKVLEEQKAYQYLDSEPRTLTAMDHRPAYATDGDYFSNPNAENVFDAVYEIMHEANPKKFTSLYR